MQETFRVIVECPGGGFEEKHKGVPKTWSAIQRLLHGPAAQLGMITSLKVVDSGDSVVFSARDGEVLFPK